MVAPALQHGWHSMLSAPAMPFSDSESLGDAWHAVGGYFATTPSEDEMKALLGNNVGFAFRLRVGE